MMEVIWGVKTQAIFDVWTFEHILSGISVGTGVMIHNKKYLGRLLDTFKEKVLHQKQISFIKYKYDLMLVLLLAYVWETIEHYLETGLAGGWVEFWFQGVEMWANRLISDPLMLVFGYFLAKRYPFLVLPARVLSVIWLVVHLFVFPHSMYLHHIF